MRNDTASMGDSDHPMMQFCLHILNCIIAICYGVQICVMQVTVNIHLISVSWYS